MKRIAVLLALLAIFTMGIVGAVYAAGETTGQAVACATASVPDQTVTSPSHILSRDGAPVVTEPGDVTTVPGATATHCETTTYTIPTSTVTQTGPTTTVTTTVPSTTTTPTSTTTPTTTTTPPPPAGTPLACGANWNTAYQNAKPGDTLLVAANCAAGSQTINYQAAKASATQRVVFKCAAGDTVSLDLIGAQHVEFQGCDIQGDFGAEAVNRSVPTSPEATDIAVKGGRMQSFHITGAQGVLIDGVDIGHYDYSSGLGSNSLYSDDGQPTEQNVTIQNSTFQGITVPSGTHSECLFVKRVNGLTLRHNIMRGCPGLAIAMYDANQGSDAYSSTLANVLIENNFLACGPVAVCYGGGQAVEMDYKGAQKYTNVTWRFNSFVGSVYLNGPQTNGQWYGNAFVDGSMSCGVAGVTYNYNVGIGCGGTNSATAAQYVNPDRITGDYHAASDTAPQVNFVPTAAGCPADDIDGQARPMGLACDAGADERK